MEKNKFPIVSGHSSRYMPSPSQSSCLNYSNCDSSVSSSLQNARHFSHDINQMPESPPRNVGHRRSQSEILSLPDDIAFDGDLGLLGPSLLDENEIEEDSCSMYLDMDKFASSSLTGWSSGAIHSRMEDLVASTNERPRVRHQHSQSMDGSSSIKPELLGSGSEGSSLAETKKALSAAKLADIAIVDPKQAKRIWANRQSAARSKERKMRYIAELEWKVQNLQTGATTLNAQLSILQRDTNGLTSENNELKLQVQTVEQQVNLQEALNDALREEVQRLKAGTGQAISNGRYVPLGSSTFSANPKFHRNLQAMPSLMMARQLQQQQIHSQPHQQQFQPSSELKMKGLLTSFNNTTPRNE